MLLAHCQDYSYSERLTSASWSTLLTADDHDKQAPWYVSQVVGDLLMSGIWIEIQGNSASRVVLIHLS
jgi:hypothetical protein